jgi:uncharacterized protein
MLGRREESHDLKRLLRSYPVVAILGPQQVGKATLALAVAKAHRGPTTHFDLERPADLQRLIDPSIALERLRGLVVLDGVQRRPELFPLLRVLADRPRKPARFLVLGSASPDLLRQSSESLAGRIAYRELSGLRMRDAGAFAWRELWLRGGFPRSFLARSDAESFEWRDQFVRTFLERDIAQLGFTVPASTMERFWSMIAHDHRQVWNASELARSFGVAHTTTRRYLDLLRDTFMVRVLPPWTENLGKRVVKSPKVYVSDTGLLHALLRIHDAHDLERHPKLGASFEGYALAEVTTRLGADARECFFWATHQGAELDLLVVRGRKRLGFEFKHTSAPGATTSMRIALEDLKLDRLDVIHAGQESYPLSDRIRAISIARIGRDLDPLR